MSSIHMDKNNKNTKELRRAERIGAQLPFSIEFGGGTLNGSTRDISPTGLFLVPDEPFGELPPSGTLVKAWVRGPAEDAWREVNTRTLRVVRVVERPDEPQQFGVGLEYVDIEN